MLNVQSGAKPDWSHLPRGYLAEDDGGRLKPVDQAYAGFREGWLLRFRLRANPTRNVDTKSGADGVRRNWRCVPVGGLEELILLLAREAGQHGVAPLQASVAASGSPGWPESSNGSDLPGCSLLGDVWRCRTLARFIGAGPVIGSGKACGFVLLSVGLEKVA